MRIKEIREKLGLTQEQFAHKMQVAAYTIRRWESGKSEPQQIHQQQLDRLARKLVNVKQKED